MPAVLLVRHGQASFGADDYDVLSPLGREQSEVVGRELARRGLRDPLVVSGRLRRQRDTAELAVAAADWSLDVPTDDRLDEYDLHGLVERYAPGLPYDGTSRDLQRLLDIAVRAWADAGDREGWTAFSSGAVAAVAEIAARAGRGRDAVVFTSGGIIAAVCAHVLGLGSAGLVALNRVTANGAVTKLVVGASGTNLVSFNDHAHLEGRDRALLTYR